MAETVKNIAVLEKALHIMEFLLAIQKGYSLMKFLSAVGLNKSTDVSHSSYSAVATTTCSRRK